LLPLSGQVTNLANLPSESLQIKKEMMEENALLTLAASGVHEGGMNSQLDVDGFQLVILGPDGMLSTLAPTTQLLTSPPATPASASQAHNSAVREEDASIWDTVEGFEDDVLMGVEY
jgi:hypothetical protein